MFSPEVLRLVAIVAVAIGVLFLYQNLIGQQQVGGEFSDYTQECLPSFTGCARGDEAGRHRQRGGYFTDTGAAAGASSVPVKTTDHAQVDGIDRDQQYMAQVKQDQLYSNNTNVLPHPQMSNTSSPQGNFQPSQAQNVAELDCFPKDQLSAADLIPREDAYNAWNQSNPPVQGALSNVNFVDSGHHYGLNTVGSTLKNPNLQLRSDPLIPQRQVGPWNQSPIEADTNRRPFEVGGF